MCIRDRAYRDKGSTGVILNTIQDVALLYDSVRELLSEDERANLYFLSGRLTPLHKRARLKTIKEALSKSQPVLVISTQVLEAGVDLSFRVLFREMCIRDRVYTLNQYLTTFLLSICLLYTSRCV